MNLLAAPVLIPLFAAAGLLLVRTPSARLAVSVTAAAATLLAAVAVAARALGGEVLVLQMAGWPAPYGISLVADRLTAWMLLLSGSVGLLSVLLAGVTLRHPPARGRSALLNRAREAFGTQSLLQFLFMGVNMSFLTGDLFNLFVAFEVMLVASYGLLLLGGELPQLREGFKYVVINLVSSAIFVLGAGLAYGLVGSLNMADMAARLEAHGPDPRVTALALVLTLVFATKAAMFPLGFWLPDSYPVPAAATSAFFAAILTKVGVYALVRIHTLIFPGEQLPGQLLLGLAGVTVLIGSLGAITRQRWRPSLAFANVASVGYVLLGAFLGGTGLAAAVYYLGHSVLVVFALFAVAAVAERISGSDYRVEGHLARYPWLGVGFFLAALAVAGLPPTSGFIGKFGLVTALLDRGGALATWGAVAGLLGSLLLLYAAVQIWRDYFWGEEHAVHQVPLPATLRGVTAVAVSLTLAFAVFAGPAYRQAEAAAAQLLDGGDYRRAVLDAPPPPGFDPGALQEEGAAAREGRP